MKPIKFNGEDVVLFEEFADVADAMRALGDWSEWVESKTELLEIVVGISEKYQLVEIGRVWAFYADDNVDDQIGRYYAEENGIYDALPENLRSYFNVKSYGRDIRLESTGAFWVINKPHLVDNSDNLGKVYELREL